MSGKKSVTDRLALVVASWQVAGEDFVNFEDFLVSKAIKTEDIEE